MADEELDFEPEIADDPVDSKVSERSSASKSSSGKPKGRGKDNAKEARAAKFTGLKSKSGGGVGPIKCKLCYQLIKLSFKYIHSFELSK